MSDYPDCLGVFPLPQVVLFPHVHLPLHVFEPRYRALLEDALQHDGRFVVAALKPGWESDYHGCPDVHPYACAGRVLDHMALEDGCSDIIFRGERVVRIDEFVDRVPFRRAMISPHGPDDALGNGASGRERVEELRSLLDRACPGARERLESCLVNDVEEDGGLELLHTLAMNLPVEQEQKLGWLACEGALARWQAIRGTLQRLAASRELRRRVLQQYDDVRPEKPGRN